MLGVLMERIFGSYGPMGWSFKRYQYKRVWNAVSKSEQGAKVAVAGTDNEAELTESTEFILDMMQKCVGVNRDDVILEIGAGVGRVGAVLAPLCREWIGTDVSENMVRHIRARLKAFPNVRAIATSGYDLAAIPSASIDLVYATVVFMHLSQWDRFLYVKEAYRVLKPGGRIFIDSVDIMSDEGWAFFEGHLAYKPGERPPNISELSTPQELTTYLKRAGFREIADKTIAMMVHAYGRK